MTQGWGLINLKRTGTGRPNKGTRGGETRDKGNTGLTPPGRWGPLELSPPFTPLATALLLCIRVVH